jgi:hypothetical protein
MQNKKTILLAATLLGLHNTESHAEHLFAAQELVARGFDFEKLAQEFRNQAGVRIEADDRFKVSLEDEGKNIKFETLDRYSIIVPILTARSPYNKVAPL